MTYKEPSSQKETERKHLHSFRCLCADFPSGELTEGETPDFLVATSTGRKIGIEHTHVFKKDGTDETAEQADEAIKEFITAFAQTRAEALGLPPAHVTLFFNPQYLRSINGPKRRSFTKTEKELIAEKLAKFIGANMPAEGASAEFNWRPDRGHPRQVDLILINRVYPVGRPRWRWLEMNPIQYDGIERIQNAITGKGKVYKACVCRCDECWLLVVADSFRSSGNIHPDKASLSHDYDSPFERTYFLDFGIGRVYRLNTKRDFVQKTASPWRPKPASS
jgi:hypothetical protein